MPTIWQAQQHYDWMKQQQDEAAARESAARAQVAGYQSDEQKRQAQYAAERDALLHQYQSQTMNQQAGLNTQQAWTQGDIQSRLAAQGAQAQAAHTQQQAGIQSQQMNQQAGINWNANIQQHDLASQYRQVALNQDDEMYMKNLDRAKSRVMNDPNLAPDEKENLITQIVTKLNPLENRQRQASILHSQLQSQGLQQQNEQQATLFNQQQEWRAGGIQNALRTVNIGGQDYHMYVNHRGEPTILDTSGQAQDREMRLAQGALGLAQGVQQHGFNQQANPLQLEALQQRNEFTAGMNPIQIATAAHNLQLSQATAPAVVQHALLTNSRLAQQISQSEDTHPQTMAMMNAQIDNLLQTTTFNALSQPERMNLLRADVALRTNQAAGAEPDPEMDAANLRYRQAGAAYIEAQNMELRDPRRVEAERVYNAARTDLIQIQADVMRREHLQQNMTPVEQREHDRITRDATAAVRGEMQEAQRARSHYFSGLALRHDASGRAIPPTPEQYAAAPPMPRWAQGVGLTPDALDRAVNAETARRIERDRQNSGLPPLSEIRNRVNRQATNQALTEIRTIRTRVTAAGAPGDLRTATTTGALRGLEAILETATPNNFTPQQRHEFDLLMSTLPREIRDQLSSRPQ